MRGSNREESGLGAPEHQNFRQNSHDVDGTVTAEETRLAAQKVLSDRFTGQSVVIITDMHLETDYNLNFEIEIAKQTGRPLALEVFRGREEQKALDDFAARKIDRREFLDQVKGYLFASDTPEESTVHYYTNIARGNAFYQKIANAIEQGVKFYAAAPDDVKDNGDIARHLADIARDNHQGVIVVYGQDHTISSGWTSGGGPDVDRTLRDMGQDVLILDPIRRTEACSSYMVDRYRSDGMTEESCAQSLEKRSAQINQGAKEDQDPDRYQVNTKTGETKPVRAASAAEWKPDVPAIVPFTASSP